MEKQTEARIEKLRKSLLEHNLDAMMISIEENRRYLSGFTGEDHQFDESAGTVFVTADKLMIATDSRFDLQAENEAPDFEVYTYKKGLMEEFPQIIAALNVKTVGFESMRITQYQHRKIMDRIKDEKIEVSLVAADQLMQNQRITKDDREIETIRKALRIAEVQFMALYGQLQAGITEIQAAWELEKLLRAGGAEGLSFPSIVASGPNSALPHAIPGDRKFQEGEPLLFDWGTKLGGYCSDISRTVILGKADDKFNEIFDIVSEAQRMATASIKPGISTKEVDRIARDYIAEKGYGENFGHGLGHGVGLAIHEAPRLSPLQDIPLEKGMVVTVEPGIYIAGWGGIRLENMVAVTDDGAEVLNSIDCRII